MVIVMRPGASEEQIQAVMAQLRASRFDVHRSAGANQTVLGAVGAQDVDYRPYGQMEGVQDVHRVSEPYKLASRSFHPGDSTVDLGRCQVGAGSVVVMAGPCTIESLEQCDIIASRLSELGGQVMRGGAFKPRTSPYSFQGHGEEGLKIIRKVCDRYGLLVVSEVMEISQLPLADQYIDIIQLGTRNMQNYPLLRAVGRQSKPVLLKRGMSATIEDLLLAAEYIMSEGNTQVMLCERGIRTFETQTRNTLDLAAIPVVKSLSHLPIMVDPSHAMGSRDKVPPMALAAVAAGADGLLVEVHADPETAVCDGAQSLTLDQFETLMNQLEGIARVVGSRVARSTQSLLTSG